MADEKPKRARSRPPAPSGRAAEVEETADEGLELNRRIIGLLQQDGRMPYSTIAAQVGVSEGTIRNRVRQLIDDHVITIQAEALPAAFGYNFNALTFIKVAPGVPIDEVARRLSDVPEVYYLIMVLGRFDLSVATYHRSQEEFREFLTMHCYGHADIIEVENSLVLKVHKMTLQWDLNTDIARRPARG